ncbi:MAG: PAS domain S-box protein, partial [Halobaculum sp.]
MSNTPTLDRDGGERERTSPYRALVEESQDIATIIDEDGTMTYVSPAVKRVLGYDPEELIGDTGYEYVHPDDRERNAQAVEAVLENPDEPQSVEVRFRHADGSWCWIEATMRNRLEDSVIDGILLNSREITERKEQERELRELAGEY